MTYTAVNAQGFTTKGFVTRNQTLKENNNKIDENSKKGRAKQHVYVQTKELRKSSCSTIFLLNSLSSRVFGNSTREMIVL